ncbi:MAG: succinate dehydrogenase, cytochrome b556 subunit [Paracoccaceae bacterium]|jgi:succinate dehydrogenase / fumarate reductase cytochrome b subunit|nr:succinate dehydrogenase, cytochrome b556 subunit [Paracoccaceae bacterium]MDP7186343.1 succinate dehydrogenase, cytochrome b556 subunit [Paracoccaceae bacterium]
MADVNRGNRPLSPHLTIYRLPITAITSILVRITGNALLISAALVVWWLLAAATSESYFDLANAVITSFLGDLVMLLSLLGLWYHTLGGIRHLIWDQIIALENVPAEKMSWAMLIGSVVLTALTVVLV